MSIKQTHAFALVIAAALLLAPGALRAQSRRGITSGTGAYFPLSVGNQWVYTRAGATGTGAWKAEVLEKITEANGRAYFALGGYFDARREVRSTLTGAVLEYNPGGTYDDLWYLLGAPVGTAWVMQLAPAATPGPLVDCVNGSRLVLASRSETLKVPAGEFADVVRVDYQSPCADGGILSEWFAPGVGLVRRAENSIAGPVFSDLAQAEVGDVVYPRLPYSTTLALDSPLYINNLKPVIPPAPLPTVSGLLILRNRSSDPIEFDFGGCRSATIEVLDDLGQVVERVKADDGGCCVCRNITQVVLVDDILALPFSFTLQGSDGRPLTGARYRVVGTFDTFDPPSLRPSASATFDVRSLR